MPLAQFWRRTVWKSSAAFPRIAEDWNRGAHYAIKIRACAAKTKSRSCWTGICSIS